MGLEGSLEKAYPRWYSRKVIPTSSRGFLPYRGGLQDVQATKVAFTVRVSDNLDGHYSCSGFMLLPVSGLFGLKQMKRSFTVQPERDWFTVPGGEFRPGDWELVPFWLS